MKASPWRWLPLIPAVLFAALLLRPYFKEQKLSWHQSYWSHSDQPYGTKVFKELLKESLGAERWVEFKGYFPDSLLHGEEPANYIYLHSSWHLDSLKNQQLLDFLANGNRAFLLVKSPPKYWMERLLSREWGEEMELPLAREIWDSIAQVKLFPTSANDDTLSVRLEYHHRGQPALTSFYGLVLQPEDEGFRTLGTLQDSLCNFFALEFEGGGQMFVHSTPLIFTNFFLRERGAFAYADRVAGLFTSGKVLWDDTIGFPNSGEMPRARRRLGKDAALKYILSQPALAWAWYLILGAGLLFLLFRARREQRPIPLQEPPRNLSLEFVEVTSRLHLSQGDHRYLLDRNMQLFLSGVHRRYGLSTRELDEAFVQQLARRSGVAQKLISALLSKWAALKEAPRISREELLDFYRLLHAFYRGQGSVKTQYEHGTPPKGTL